MSAPPRFGARRTGPPRRTILSAACTRREAARIRRALARGGHPHTSQGLRAVLLDYADRVLAGEESGISRRALSQ